MSLLYEPNLKNAVAKAVRDQTAARFPDGDGLTLVVSASTGRATWVHRYSFRGRKPERSMGTYPKMGLADARAARLEDVALIKRDRNPVEVHALGEHCAVPTFAEFATAHFKRLAPPSQRHLAATPRLSQWYRDVTELTGPLANLPVDDVRVTDVEAVVKPMWKGDVAPPKAVRIASAIARVMDHRVALNDPNRDPEAATWAKTLVKRLRKRVGDEKHVTKHYAALPVDKAPECYRRLRLMREMAARVLEWTIVTGCRVQEAAKMRFRELDMTGHHSTWTWTVPAKHRKSQKNKGAEGQDFVVPLSYAMVRCIRLATKNRVDDLGPNDLVFPSYGCNFTAAKRKATGKASTTDRRYKRAGGTTAHTNTGVIRVTKLFADLTTTGEITTHGFRTTMVAWGVKLPHLHTGPFSEVIMDRAVGHGINPKKDKVSAALPAYLRLDGEEDPYLEQRAVVTREWSLYLRGRAPVKPRGRGRGAPVEVKPEVEAERPALRLVA